MTETCSCFRTMNECNCKGKVRVTVSHSSHTGTTVSFFNNTSPHRILGEAEYKSCIMNGRYIHIDVSYVVFCAHACKRNQQHGTDCIAFKVYISLSFIFFYNILCYASAFEKIILFNNLNSLMNNNFKHFS